MGDGVMSGSYSAQPWRLYADSIILILVAPYAGAWIEIAGVEGAAPPRSITFGLPKVVLSYFSCDKILTRVPK